VANPKSSGVRIRNPEIQFNLFKRVYREKALVNSDAGCLLFSNAALLSLSLCSSSHTKEMVINIHL
jgi:hypothetical protein